MHANISLLLQLIICLCNSCSKEYIKPKYFSTCSLERLKLTKQTISSPRAINYRTAKAAAV